MNEQPLEGIVRGPQVVLPSIKREKIKPANCPHKTITTNRRTGQARCYSCGKWMPNALLSKDQQRLDKFMEAE